MLLLFANMFYIYIIIILLNLKNMNMQHNQINCRSFSIYFFSNFHVAIFGRWNEV